MAEATRIQMHVQLPYKQEPRVHPGVAEKLAAGWKVAGFQRLTDRDALVTLERAPSDQP